MAIAIGTSIGAAQYSSASALIVTKTITVSAGDCVLLGFAGFRAGTFSPPTSVADNQSNTWIRRAMVADDGGGNTSGVLYVCPATAGGGTLTISITYPDDQHVGWVDAVAISGHNSSIGTWPAQDANSAKSVSWHTGTVTLSQTAAGNGIAVCLMNIKAQGNATSPATPSGWTLIDKDYSASVVPELAWFYKSVSAGSLSVTPTWTSTNDYGASGLLQIIPEGSTATRVKIDLHGDWIGATDTIVDCWPAGGATTGAATRTSGVTIANDGSGNGRAYVSATGLGSAGDSVIFNLYGKRASDSAEVGVPWYGTAVIENGSP